MNVSDEDRDVWKLYVQIGKKKADGKLFDTALAYCKVGVRPTIHGGDVHSSMLAFPADG